MTIVPEWVRFQDVNPFTGAPYARSRFADLPGYAAWVVTDVLDLTSGTWDALVCSGEVAAVAASCSYFRVTDWLRWAAERQSRPAQSWECSMCWGTCVAFDVDASITGVVGTPVICWCAESWWDAEALHHAEQGGGRGAPLAADRRGDTAPTAGRVLMVDSPVEPVSPDTFSLADVNPFNGLRYLESPYLELPPYVVAVIGLTRGAWDGLVRAGAVGLVFDMGREYPLAPTLGELRDRQRLVWDGELDVAELVGVLCGGCLGTAIAHDFDASVTGLVDAPYVCGCVVSRSTLTYPSIISDAGVSTGTSTAPRAA
ncbi:MAG: hypothetical protein ACRDRH_13665 [Pseudonocardia sp.]